MAENNKTTEELEAEKLAAEKAAMKAEVEKEEAEKKAQAEKDAADKEISDRYKTQAEKDADLVSKLVREKLEQELSPIKGKLDAAFKQRDEALQKIAEFERKEKEATLKRLEEEGKHKEAFEMRLSEERAEKESLKKRVTELSRDVAVRDALKSMTFRNDKAAEMAFKEIITNLVQTDDEKWVHRSGVSIRDYCEAFSKDDEQSFLFKAKTSSGAGTGSSKDTGGSGTGKKSLFDMSQAEVLKLAAEGKI